MKKRYFILFLLCVFSLALFGCGSKEVEKTFELDKTEIKLYVGETEEITVQSTGLDGEVRFSSSNSNVAKVENGKVTAIGEGEATISVSCDVFLKTVKVTVTYEKFDVKFMVDGKEISSMQVKKGEDAIAPNDPTKQGYEFKGWDKEFTNVKANLEVNALFRRKYTVSYELNGGSLLAIDETDYRYDDEDFTAPKAGKVGYKFKGWTKSATDDGNYVTVIKASEEGDVTLHAQYEEKSSFDVSFNFDGGATNELFLANTSEAVASVTLTAYNTKPSGFWAGGYANYSYVCQKASDPAATFSDRVYFGVDAETGFYKVYNIVTSGSGTWPKEATHVITASNSYSDSAAFGAEIKKVSVGDYVIFSGDFTKNATNPTTAYFFSGTPQGTVTQNILKGKTLPLASRLGFDFSGWYDAYGNKATTGDDLYDGMELIAHWTEKNPVTSLSVNPIKEEFVVGETLQVVASVKPLDAYFTKILYSTSNKDVIDITSSGLMTAKNAGTVTITITDYMKKFSYIKEITVYPVDQVAIEFNEFEDGVLSVGETLQLTPKAFGKGVEGLTFTYKSSDETILKVSNTGLLTAMKEGVATITITDSAQTTHTLEVGIVVNNLSASTKVDEVIKLIAENNFAVVETGNVSLYNDGTDRYYEATYGSVNKYLFQEYEVDDTYKVGGKANMEAAILANGKSDSHYRDPGEDDIEFVTVHDTATLTGTVSSIVSIYNSTDTSIHYSVGNGLIMSAIPEEYIAFHAGDGTSVPFAWYNTNVVAGENDPVFGIVKENNKYYFTVDGTKTSIEVPDSGATEPKLTNIGPTWKIEGGYVYMGKPWYSSTYGYIGSKGGNNNSIGIEMCVNTTSDIYLTWQQTAQLCADICLRNGLSLDRIKQHNTFSGKNCPQCLISAGYWWNFIEMVKVEYEMMSKYSDVKVTMKSNDPSILADNGRIINAPIKTTTVSYTVTVTCGAETKTITLYSVVPGTSTWEMWHGTYSAAIIWNDGKFAYTVK